ncbi:MAG: Gfo/Idh/MocA family oxidoreductase [Quadrisphaera sp.]
MTLPRIVVVGVHGYGANHVATALRLQREGRARLVGLVDPKGGPVVADGGAVVPDTDLPARWPDLDALLADQPVDVVVVATPLHTHAALGRQALEAGADVLLEKPPVTRREQLADLLAVESANPGRVQVGFQALGSAALAAVGAAVRDGSLGEVRRISARGSWTRDAAYYARAPWAGRRTLGGVDVVDGALTNPFAHAVADLLHLAGLTGADAVARVEVELFRSRDIEADDTAALRVVAADGTPAAGVPVVGAFTLAGPADARPWVQVTGARASLRLHYDVDRVEVLPGTDSTDSTDSSGSPGAAGAGPLPDLLERPGLAGQHPRRGLLEDLLARRTDGGPLLAPLAATAGFVEVVEAVRAATVTAVDPAHVRWEGVGGVRRPVLEGVDAALDAVVHGDGGLFRATGARWAG